MVRSLLRKAMPAVMAALVLSACATAHKNPSPRHSKPAARQQAKPVDAKAQKQYYDTGLQYYSRENYPEAKKAFQHVVDLGPNTSLGLKAQENLRKIQQIMKTLKEIESK